MLHLGQKIFIFPLLIILFEKVHIGDGSTVHLFFFNIRIKS